MGNGKRTETRAVFLDRDGTVIEDGDYLSDPEEIRLLSGAGPAIRALNEAGWYAIVVSNQSGIGRGYFNEQALERVQERLVTMLSSQGARIDDFFYCPHTPEENCTCRKPNQGLLLAASQRHGIVLERSWMVGDKESDIEAGHRAGCSSCLVLTGYGSQEVAKTVRPELVAPDLLSAVRHILSIEGDDAE